MSLSALDHFGQLLMVEVRDRAIQQWEQTLSGEIKSEQDQRLFASLTEAQRAAIRTFTPAIVDTTLHFLLSLLDWREEIKVSVELDADIAPSISDASDGLPHELHTQKGWVARFSKKRPSFPLDPPTI